MTVPRTPDFAVVQRNSPYGPTEPKRKLLLRFEQIHPVIRIAHVQHQSLAIADRIIYDHEIVLVTQGAVSCTVAGSPRYAEAGALLFLPPFVPHALHTPPGAPHTHIAVHFDFCPEAPPPEEWMEGREPYEIVWPGGVRARALSTVAPGHWIEQTLREIVASHADERDPFGAIEASSLLSRVLIQMLRWGGRQEAPGGESAVSHVNHERMKRVLAHISANLAGPLALEELAHVADVSRSRFVTLFREATGVSPQQYIQARRIAEARRLLADPNLQIKQIAAMTGFEDRFYFSKVFRRVDGLTPTQFRAAALFGRSHIPDDELSA